MTGSGNPPKFSAAIEAEFRRLLAKGWRFKTRKGRYGVSVFATSPPQDDGVTVLRREWTDALVELEAARRSEASS